MIFENVYFMASMFKVHKRMVGSNLLITFYFAASCGDRPNGDSKKSGVGKNTMKENFLGYGNIYSTNEVVLLFCGTQTESDSLDERIRKLNLAFTHGHFKGLPEKPKVEPIELSVLSGGTKLESPLGLSPQLAAK